MKMTKTILTAAAALCSAVAFANTPLLINTNFAGYTGWIFGANRFQPKTTWLEFVSAPTAFSFESRVQPSGSGFVFQSWDDGVADKIESYIFQEFGAGPAASSTPSIFKKGDKIVFKGSASATRTGANTNDMVVRAFIKVLGYNELGWAFQTKAQYSAFKTINATLEPFELRVTFPDLAVDDSLQVLQIGFEITTEYDGTAMDKGTIYFENIQGYIEGSTWLGYPVDASGYADTTPWMGWVNVNAAPWVWIVGLNNWAYVPTEAVTSGGGWVYVVKP